MTDSKSPADDAAADQEESQPVDLPRRGSFPKGPRGETPDAKRERYELFILSTKGRLPDREGNSIRFYRGKTKQVSLGPGVPGTKEVPASPSPKRAIDSRCWQCEHGDDDPNGQQRIAGCGIQSCALWPHRPYQVDPVTPTVNRASAVRRYCIACMNGNALEVRHCTAVTCALWKLRTGADAGGTEPPAPEGPGSSPEGSMRGETKCDA